MVHQRTESFMPKEVRPRGQRWINYLREAPGRFPCMARTDQFNITISYSTITDIRVPYGITKQLSPNAHWVQEPPYSKRSKSVLWMVSNCNTQSKREDYVDELKKYIDVDIVGRCGDVDMNCPREKRNECEDKIIKQYYFYLGFENSICDDYITEKVWKRLKQGVIPVVLGRGNYSKELPNGSYIDVKDFESPKHLASHLIRIMRSEELYSSYHTWRRKQVIRNPPSAALCEICDFVYKTIGESQIIPDINEVWNETRSCISPREYYKGIFNFNNELKLPNN